ncbi:ComF family protein [Antribacter gilvus]|uniref:ComF family protein n=1 Tax=Antribacter gilvus TaxID=2304675 RepID=UPI000F7ACA8F|nr:hypothetical protein [Antribacter gilvus]
MTSQLPANVQAVADYLTAFHSGYLHNVAFSPGITCAVCGTPVNHALDSRCPPCRGHLAESTSIADRVGLMVYAEQYDAQAYRLVQQYKGDFPGPEHILVMRSLLALGLRSHVACDLKLAGIDYSNMGWAVVPSSKGRDVLTKLVKGLARRPEAQVPLVAVGDGFVKHSFRPENFLVPHGVEVPEHVLLIDDSWVSGSNAQSSAAALKRAGARDVSVFAVARVLKPTYEPTKRFLADRGHPDFDPARCPWTGKDCP